MVGENHHHYFTILNRIDDTFSESDSHLTVSRRDPASYARATGLWLFQIMTHRVRDVFIWLGITYKYIVAHKTLETKDSLLSSKQIFA
ncbi:MAG: hypothetical protein ABSE90_09935, partial [Verrucomicrobiota bacterium]|jgi:hypothetical protein